eukprot:6176305-Pleurochrysis_carterae.AAC.2
MAGDRRATLAVKVGKNPKTIALKRSWTEEPTRRCYRLSTRELTSLRARVSRQGERVGRRQAEGAALRRACERRSVGERSRDNPE